VLAEPKGFSDLDFVCCAWRFRCAGKNCNGRVGVKKEKSLAKMCGISGAIGVLCLKHFLLSGEFIPLGGMTEDT